MQFLKRHLIHELEVRHDLFLPRDERAFDRAEPEGLQLGAIRNPTNSLVHR